MLSLRFKLIGVAGLLLATAPGVAVIVPYGSGRNLSPPTGTLANAGWQYQAEFAGFLGTPISSKWFITAQHIGGTIGSSVSYNGSSTVTDAVVDVPGTDLRLWRIAGTFSTWAPMWNPATDGGEVGKRLFVVGRGTQRGAPVIAPIDGPAAPSGGGNQVAISPDYNDPIPAGYELRGWKWGAEDRLRSWGENVVHSVVDGGSTLGPLLYFTFDRDGLLNEAALSAGDSGGAVFVRTFAGQYKLAGINFGVDGPFRETPTSPGFYAAMFDMGGYYVYENPTEYFPPSVTDQPAGAYVSSISANRAFINSVIAGTFAGTADVPEPSTTALAATSAVLLIRRRRPVTPR